MSIRLKFVVMCSLSLFPVSLMAAGQVFVLSAGQSVTFEFGSIPRLDAQSGNYGCFDVTPYSLTSRWVDSFRMEAFETSTQEPPCYTVTFPPPGFPLESGPENTASVASVGLWQDLQGAARLTVISGVVRFEQPGVDVVRPEGHYAIDFVLLSIERSGTNMLLSWPRTINTQTYVVQAADALPSNNWATLTNSPEIANDRLQISVCPSAGQQFFRFLSR